MTMNITNDDLLNRLSMSGVETRRLILARRLYQHYGGTIRHGILQGVKILSDPSWGGADISSKLLGFYEKEILDYIASQRGAFDTLINIGAGDGYYGVGLLKAGFVQKSICFELSDRGRTKLKETAGLNGVSDAVTIFGKAEPDFLDKATIELSRCLVLIDIEGAEFDILTQAVLQRLKNARLIIELHGAMTQGGKPREDQLIKSLHEVFDCKLVTMGARDPSLIAELSGLNDTDRWLLCSESRGYRMQWAICSPKTGD